MNKMRAKNPNQRKKYNHFILLFAFIIAYSAPSWAAKSFTLESQEVKNHGKISDEQVFDGFGCKGKNISPSLSWKNAPSGTKSFALLVHDPDAPTGGAGWWHWIVYNIPSDVNSLPKNSGAVSSKLLPPQSIQGPTDFGATGYGGPCPPQGDHPHHYHFTLYALKVEKLDIPANASSSLIGFMVNQNSLGKAELVGEYSR